MNAGDVAVQTALRSARRLSHALRREGCFTRDHPSVSFARGLYLGSLSTAASFLDPDPVAYLAAENEIMFLMRDYVGPPR